MKQKLITLAILSTLSSSVFITKVAAAEEEPRSWEAAAELGFNLTSGNTDTSTLKTRVDVKHTLTNWDNQYILDALRQDDNGNESANKWLVAVKGNYRLEKENAFMFVEGSREEDQVGVYDNYNSLAFGYGERFYDTESVFIKADIGPGYIFFKNNGINQESENSGILRVSAELGWEISESATFGQKVIINRELSNEKNTKTRLESSVTAKINGSFQMKFGLTILNNAKVPANLKKTDTETSVTLVYSF